MKRVIVFLFILFVSQGISMASLQEEYENNNSQINDFASNMPPSISIAIKDDMRAYYDGGRSGYGYFLMSLEEAQNEKRNTDIKYLKILIQRWEDGYKNNSYSYINIDNNDFAQLDEDTKQFVGLYNTLYKKDNSGITSDNIENIEIIRKNFYENKNNMKQNISNINPAQQKYKDIIEQEENKFYANSNSSKNNDILFSNLQKKYSEVIDNLNSDFYEDINPNDAYYKNNWVKLLRAEGDYYYTINYKYLNEKYGQYISPAYNEWLDHLSKTEAIVRDGGLIIAPDKLREQIIYLENFEKQYPNFVQNKELEERIKDYLRIYLLGIDNSPIYDWETKKINPQFKSSYEKFLSENENSKYYQIVKNFYNKAKENNFIDNEKFHDWRINTYTE